MAELPDNIDKPLIRVAHAELERFSGESAYRSKCPVCEGGVLFISRDPEAGFLLMRRDRCVICGQSFYYTDETINGEGFVERVPFPMFELYGPPCEAPGCKGVLVDTLSLKTKEFFKKCATCGQEFYKMPARDALAWAVRTIEGAMKGERSN